MRTMQLSSTFSPFFRMEMDNRKENDVLFARHELNCVIVSFSYSLRTEHKQRGKHWTRLFRKSGKIQTATGSPVGMMSPWICEWKSWKRRRSAIRSRFLCVFADSDTPAVVRSLGAHDEENKSRLDSVRTYFLKNGWMPAEQNLKSGTDVVPERISS